MVRSEALKKAQKLYRQKNREHLYNRNREYNRVYALTNYDDDAKKKKNEYYLKNRNYINKDFSKDLVVMQAPAAVLAAIDLYLIESKKVRSLFLAVSRGLTSFTIKFLFIFEFKNISLKLKFFFEKKEIDFI